MSLWSASSVVDSAQTSIWGAYGINTRPKISSYTWNSRGSSHTDWHPTEQPLLHKPKPDTTTERASLVAQKDPGYCSPVTSLGIGTAESEKKDDSWFIHHARPASSMSMAARHPNLVEEDSMKLTELARSFWYQPKRFQESTPSIEKLRSDYTMILAKMEEASNNYVKLKREKDRVLTLLTKNSTQTEPRSDIISLEYLFDPDSPVQSSRGFEPASNNFAPIKSSAFENAHARVKSESFGPQLDGFVDQRKITPNRFSFTPEKSVPFRSKSNQTPSSNCDLEILKAPPTSYNFGQVCKLSREELQRRLDEADQLFQRRVFLPGRGWVSKKKLKAELGATTPR